jgi:spermidine dehydrogenase
LLDLTFEAIERETRAQLAALLSPHGFDPARDILAITVNRWPHGYAYERVELFDPSPPPGQATHEIARAQFGPIAIANSDAEGRAYADAAFDAARRAVDQLI